MVLKKNSKDVRMIIEGQTAKVFFLILLKNSQ